MKLYCKFIIIIKLMYLCSLLLTNFLKKNIGTKFLSAEGLIVKIIILRLYYYVDYLRILESARLIIQY